MAAKRGRSVPVKERPVHDELARRMLTREGVHGWTWEGPGRVVIFHQEAEQVRYLLHYCPTARRLYTAEQVAEIEETPMPGALDIASAAVVLGLAEPERVKRAGKAELAAVLRAVLEEYGDADSVAVREAKRVLEAV